jgi:Omp85 superfamily domain
VQQRNRSSRIYILAKILLWPVLITIQSYAYGQEVVPHDTLKTDSAKHHADSVKFQKKANDVSKQYDFGNLVTDILHPKKKPDSVFKKPSGITVIPNIASNPSIGFQLGIKAVAGRKLGGDPNTLLSVAATSVSYTTKGILYFYINHNIYTPGNKWNFQGNIVAAKSVTPDFGLGIGLPDPGGSAADQALVNANRKGRAYHSIYLNLREKVYKEVEKNLFVGAGVSFDIRTKIQDKADTTNHLTPYNIYSDEHGFKRDSYRADGLLFNVQYTTRDNQNRAYKGIYADAGFRVNQTWMGSTKSAVQFTTDFRKYFSLSSENPEHVIAFWNWGSYLLTGDIPYLELPGTAKDGSFRSGRGYTTGYFKGTRFNYSEVEYRFPILKNKFISGVAFFSEQTANDEAGTKLFQKFQPGGGGGLRVLFNKATRTNLCLDYAFGKFGSKGFFLGLNEAF